MIEVIMMFFTMERVIKGGKLLLLAYHEETDPYYQVENGKMIPVRPFAKYR